MGIFAKRHRYILRETLTPFLLGLAIFTFVLLMGRLLRLVEMVLNKGVPLIDILKLFAFLLPSFLVLTLPLAFLLGVLLGFGRLSSEAEVIALKSSGISLYDMAKPVLALAVAISLATALLSVFAQPQGKRASKSRCSISPTVAPPSAFNHGSSTTSSPAWSFTPMPSMTAREPWTAFSSRTSAWAANLR